MIMSLYRLSQHSRCLRARFHFRRNVSHLLMLAISRAFIARAIKYWIKKTTHKKSVSNIFVSITIHMRDSEDILIVLRDFVKSVSGDII